MVGKGDGGKNEEAGSRGLRAMGGGGEGVSGRSGGRRAPHPRDPGPPTAAPAATPADAAARPRALERCFEAEEEDSAGGSASPSPPSSEGSLRGGARGGPPVRRVHLPPRAHGQLARLTVLRSQCDALLPAARAGGGERGRAGSPQPGEAWVRQASPDGGEGSDGGAEDPVRCAAPASPSPGRSPARGFGRRYDGHLGAHASLAVGDLVARSQELRLRARESVEREGAAGAGGAGGGAGRRAGAGVEREVQRILELRRLVARSLSPEPVP